MDKRMESWKEFFWLSELAEKWNRTEDFILQMAAAGRLRLSAWWGDEYWEASSDGEWWGGDPGDGLLNDFINIDTINAKQLLLNPSVDKERGVIIVGCHTRCGRKICLISEKNRKIFDKHKAREPINEADFFPFFHYRSMVVLVDEVNRVEAEYADIRDEQIFQNQNQQTQGEDDSAVLMHPVGSQMLTGWNEIGKYLGVSESTAKRYANAGKWLRHTKTNRPITTTYEIDEWRRKTST